MIKKATIITVLFLLSACGSQNEYIVEANPEYTIQSTEMPRNYIGNKNTLKFHIPSCSYLPFEGNRQYFARREDAINSGFKACQKCKP